ncbi:hypothetical protein Patl1_24855 [Pistacia atlantica]|uniref:Uncharacterized protein n=1 Tax=Pistacia atlantica TaxID=434234 RepID=A0ACC1B4F9_9ROSI|nr:hypothetical protein Patl1_24855 [Pistacia atlantica]
MVPLFLLHFQYRSNITYPIKQMPFLCVIWHLPCLLSHYYTSLNVVIL